MNAVDLFAGAGGWSLGWQQATGLSPLLAVNHDAHAIHLHRLNHPETRHFEQDVAAVDPIAALGGQPVHWLHMSPDCTHFSRAKGGKPKSQKIRGLAWHGVKWAKKTLPPVVSLENVAEFEEWGPLDEHGQPIKARKGETFRAFVATLRRLGYTSIDWRELCAADYGAPTTRRRLYLIARRDGHPVVWPEPTHGTGRPLPWRTAAECIDWSIPCRSIFARKRPLAAATCRRIAAGFVRFVLQGKPFIVTLRGTDSAHLHGDDVDAPLRTISAGGTHHAIAAPFLHQYYSGADSSRSKDVRTPLPTITADGNHNTLAAAFLVETGNGERVGQVPRARSIERPLLTVTGSGSQGAVVAAWLQQNFTGMVGKQLHGGPLPTVTARDHHSLVAAELGADGPHARKVLPFLVQYYSQGGGQLGRITDPLSTITTRARHGLVTVEVDGASYVVVDIGLRMLRPRELARATGLPDSYVLEGTQEQQNARIGNAVCPDVAAAIVRANAGVRREAVA